MAAGETFALFPEDEKHVRQPGETLVVESEHNADEALEFLYSLISDGEIPNKIFVLDAFKTAEWTLYCEMNTVRLDISHNHIERHIHLGTPEQCTQKLPAIIAALEAINCRNVDTLIDQWAALKA